MKDYEQIVQNTSKKVTIDGTQGKMYTPGELARISSFARNLERYLLDKYKF